MSEDICPCCGKKLRRVVPVSDEARVILESLVPDEDGFVCVPRGLLKYADKRKRLVR